MAFTMLPFINDMIVEVFKVELLSSEILNTLSTTAILGIVISSIIMQGKKAIKGMVDLMEVSSDVEKVTWEVEEE
jgi:hypothetical protein